MTNVREDIQTLEDLANLHPDQSGALKEFREKHDLEHELSGKRAQKYGDSPDKRTLFFRDLAQRLWTDLGDQGGIALLDELLFPEGKDAVFIDWRRQRLAYRPSTKLQAAFYVLLSNSHLAKRCANPDCAHPFFIGRRVDERYCSDECKDIGRLATKRNWWSANRAKGTRGKR